MIAALRSVVQRPGLDLPLAEPAFFAAKDYYVHGCCSASYVGGAVYKMVCVSSDVEQCWEYCLCVSA